MENNSFATGARGRWLQCFWGEGSINNDERPSAPSETLGTIRIEVRPLEWRFKSAEEIYPSAMQTQLMALLRAEGSPDSDFDSAELICVELIGNLIRHARGPVTIRLDWSEEFAKLAVIDEQRFVAPAIGLPADPLAESGRGLFIIKSLAKDLSLLDAGHGGSTTCATLPVKRAA